MDVIVPLKRIEHCPLNLQSHVASLCPLHARIGQTIAATEKIFRETTIADLLTEPGSVSPVCENKTLVTLDSMPPSQVESKNLE